jgi:predicted nucleic acid-binding protein
MRDRLRFTFDANVLIYAGVADDLERHRIAGALIRRAVGCDCILIAQALAEFFAASTRKAKLPVARASSLIESWLRLFPCRGATTETLRSALQTRARHGVGFWDAMLWAVAREGGCRYLLSENLQTGRTLGGVTFVNPFAPAGLPQEVERLLGPAQG